MKHRLTYRLILLALFTSNSLLMFTVKATEFNCREEVPRIKEFCTSTIDAKYPNYTCVPLPYHYECNVAHLCKICRGDELWELTGDVQKEINASLTAECANRRFQFFKNRTADSIINEPLNCDWFMKGYQEHFPDSFIDYSSSSSSSWIWTTFGLLMLFAIGGLVYFFVVFKKGKGGKAKSKKSGKRSSKRIKERGKSSTGRGKSSMGRGKSSMKRGKSSISQAKSSIRAGGRGKSTTGGASTGSKSTTAPTEVK